MLDQRNTHKKNFRTTKYPQEKIWDPRSAQENKFETHEIPARKNVKPTKARWYGGTRTTMARDQRNLAHSIQFCYQHELFMFH